MKTLLTKTLVLLACVATLPPAARAQELDYAPMEFSSFGNWAAVTGSGFNYKTNSFTGYECVGGTEELTGSPDSNLAFSTTVDQSTLQKELGISGDFRTVTGPGEITAGAKYMKATTEDSFSITLNYVGTFKFANRVLRSATPNAVGKEAGRFVELLDKKCGQGFVQQIVRGAKLFISIRFDFTSRDDKEAFGAHFDYRSPLTDVSAKVDNSTKSFARRTRVTVSAYQVGGQVEKVAYIFQKGIEAARPAAPSDTAAPGEGRVVSETENAGDANSSYTFISCSFGDIDKCKSVLANAIHYATSRTDPESFPRQVNSAPTGDANGQKLFANLSYLIVPNAFTEFIKVPGLKQAVEEQKAKLVQLLMDNVTDLHKIQNLQSGKIEYTNDQRTTFRTGEATLRARQEKILKTAYYCYQQDESNCGSKVAEMNRELETIPFDKAVLDPMPVTFGQFCSSAHAVEPKFLDKRVRDSVYAIEQAVAGNPLYRTKLDEQGYSKEESDAVDKCVIMNKFLLGQSKLDLSYGREGFKIFTLEPIRNLANLQELVAQNQNIEDVGALQFLKNLESVDLSGNAIKDVTAFRGLPYLRELRLARNKIRSVAVLDGAPALEYLDVRANFPSVECFSNETLKQCLLARSKWVAQFSPVANDQGLEAVLPQATETSNAFHISGLREGLDLNSIMQMVRIGNNQGYMQSGGHIYAPRFWSANANVGDDKILITGGWPFQSLATMELYDAKAGNYLSSGRLTEGRAGHTATVISGNRVLVVGGYYSLASVSLESARLTAEIVDPLAAGGPKVVTTVNMRAARAWHTATALPGGKVLIIGGFAGGRGIGSIELFDPATNSSRIIGNLIEPRGAHTVTPLGGNKFLILGGFTDQATALGSAEIFDLASFRSRKLRGQMSEPRGMHSVQLLANGELLILGGSRKAAVMPTADSTANADALGLIRMLSSTFGFVDETTGSSKTCSSCLKSAELFLPSEESFASNPFPMSGAHAGAALMPLVQDEGPFSFTIWGGLDKASSRVIDSGVVTEDPL